VTVEEGTSAPTGKGRVRLPARTAKTCHRGVRSNRKLSAKPDAGLPGTQTPCVHRVVHRGACTRSTEVQRWVLTQTGSCPRLQRPRAAGHPGVSSSAAGTVIDATATMAIRARSSRAGLMPPPHDRAAPGHFLRRSRIATGELHRRGGGARLGRPLRRNGAWRDGPRDHRLPSVAPVHRGSRTDNSPQGPPQ
jgi:hypothetical protein